LLGRELNSVLLSVRLTRNQVGEAHWGVAKDGKGTPIVEMGAYLVMRFPYWLTILQLAGWSPIILVAVLVGIYA